MRGKEVEDEEVNDGDDHDNDDDGPGDAIVYRAQYEADDHSSAKEKYRIDVIV